MTTHPTSLGATRLQHLRALRDRLGDLSMRNRALRLVRLYRKRAFDFAWLDAIAPGESHRLLQAVLSGQKRKAPILTVGRDDEPTRVTHNGLTYLDREVRLVEAERGVYDLSVGFPFLCGVLPEGRYVQAPLLLLPRRLELERKSASGTRWVLAPDDPTEVHVNRSLLLALQKYAGVTIDPDRLLDTAEGLLFGRLGASADLLDLTAEFAALLPGVTVSPTLDAWGVPSPPTDPPQVPSLPEYRSTELPTPRTCAFELRPHAVLSRFPLADSALLADYDALIQLIEQIPDRRLGYTGALLGERDAIREAQRVRDAAPAPRWHVEPTDESQDDVLAQVLAGRSLAVSGPPGTGKSQLIANLVATALAQGKRVLVVSQKRPALDVVSQRLGTDLGQFVALVHDPVRDQQAVRERVLATLGQHRFAVPEPTSAPRDRALRDIKTLEGRFDELHRALSDQSAGQSAFEAYGRRVRDAGTPGAVPVHALPPLDPADLEEAIPALERLVQDRAFARTPGTWREHRPSYAERPIDARDRFLAETLRQAEQVLAESRRWDEGRETLPELTATAARSDAYLAIDRWCASLPDAAEAVFWRSFVALQGASTASIQELMSAVQRVIARDTAAEGGTMDLTNADLERAEAVFVRYAREEANPFRVFFPAWYQVRTQVRELLAAAGLSPFQVDRSITTWRARAANTEARWEAGRRMRELGLGLDRDTDLPELLGTLRAARDAWVAWRQLPADLSALNERPPGSPGELQALRRRMSHALAAGPIAQRLGKVERALREWIGPAASRWVADARSRSGEVLRARFLEEVSPHFERFAEADRRIAETERRFQALVPIALERMAARGEVGAELRCAYAERWVRDAEARHPALQRSRQVEDTADRAKLAELWHKLPALNRTLLAGRLAAGVTALDTQRGQLERRAEQKRSRWPLRKLVESFWSEGLGEVLPVWLSSPEAVASVFPLTEGFFDLVVFDEASQCTVEQGLTAVYRGKTCVIAGDEQQLPPSNLFAATLEEDDDELDSPAAEESLLARAKALGAEAALSWHYRSRFPELIAFSNLRFYNRALRVAPVPVPRFDPPALQWVAVDGAWTKRANEVEAAAAVELLDRYLREHPDQSIGIITLNRQQADWIQDLIDARVRDSAAFRERYERAMAGDLDARPFVRNLENVQGDERDVIVLSVAYSAGANGQVPMRFGSLNLSGGERRLNVAVSRARRKMVVLCSFDPETQLQPSESVSRGAQDLAAFLRYARGAGRGEAPAVAGYAAYDLVDAVAEALERFGWRVDRGVGTSEARVDLAVRSHVAPDRYALGVLFDGPGAAWARTVIGREVGRVAFLERYHWRVQVLSARALAKDFEGTVRDLVGRIRAAEQTQDAVAAPPSVPVPKVDAGVSTLAGEPPVRRSQRAPAPPSPEPARAEAVGAPGVPEPSAAPQVAPAAPPAAPEATPVRRVVRTAPPAPAPLPVTPVPARQAVAPAPEPPRAVPPAPLPELVRALAPPTVAPPAPVQPPLPLHTGQAPPRPAAVIPAAVAARPPVPQTVTVGPGCTVTFRNTETERETTITLAGPSIPRGVRAVGIDAPLAQVLLDQDVGAILDHPANGSEIEILAVKPPPPMPEIG